MAKIANNLLILLMIYRQSGSVTFMLIWNLKNTKWDNMSYENTRPGKGVVSFKYRASPIIARIAIILAILHQGVNY